MEAKYLIRREGRIGYETYNDPKRAAKYLLDNLSDDERYDLFHEYCVHCGDKNPKCQCWNDE